MNLEEFLEKRNIIELAFNEILNVDYVSNRKKYPCDIAKIGFEYFTINVAHRDLREEEKYKKRSNYAKIYAYTRMVDRDKVSADITRRYHLLSVGLCGYGQPPRIRVTAKIDFETGKIKIKSRVVRLTVPDIQHLSFPTKDDFGNWNFDFSNAVGKLTKAAK